MLSVFLLIIALVFNAVLNEREGRSFVGLAVLIPTCAHFVLANDLTGLQYYGSVAVMCCISFAFLELLPDSPLVSSIQAIQIAGILINFFGILMWYAYQEPMLYNVLITTLVIIEWARLMARTKADGEHWACNYMRTLHSNAGLHNVDISKQ